MGKNTKKLDYNGIVIDLLNFLNEREKEVLLKRHSLNGNQKATLEEIGQAYNITRERVRQIENEALKKVQGVKTKEQNVPLAELETLVAEFIAQHGGFIGQEHLMDKLIHTDENNQYTALNFLLDKVLSGGFNRTKLANFDIVWRIENVSEELINELGESLRSLIEGKNKPLNFEEIIKEFGSHPSYSKIDSLPAENHDIVEALLRAREDLNRNILNQWGADHWTTIRPKRMTDKAYLIMLRENRPLHFEECANLINEAGFDKKKACAATVHNELILDDKYVLVGRGIYALKDWGYEEGTVTDIIARILGKSGPLSKKEITDNVLKQRLVQKTTITLALMNKDKFAKNESGNYQVVA